MTSLMANLIEEYDISFWSSLSSKSPSENSAKTISSESRNVVKISGLKSGFRTEREFD